VSKVLHPFGVFHRDMSFEEFARAACAIPDTKADPHWRSQYTFLINGRGQIAMNFVGRFERLSKDLEQVKLHCASELAVPHLLKSEHASYRDYYSNSLRELVAERYAKDLNCFGYAFT
jgi:chondroitin 4-sulfotransferase 11